MNKEQELKEMLKLYSKQELWNRIQEKQAMIYDLQLQLAEKDKQQNQKAIEQLEKVKTTVKHFCELHSDEYYGVKSQVMGINQDVCEYIDQQIKELKGNVEDVKD